jgi:hypothetical protein
VKKPYALQDSWGKEHTTAPWTKVPHDAETRCPMCGECHEQQPDPAHDALEVLRRLADCAWESPTRTLVMLYRLMRPNETLDAIAGKMQRVTNRSFTKQACYSLLTRSSRDWPTLAAMLTPRSFDATPRTTLDAPESD